MNQAPRRLRDLMPASHKARYLMWRALPFPESIRVRLRTGEALVLRSEPAGDLGNAYEIFVSDAYRPPRSLSPPIRRIVDVGANVGNSVVYFATRYPDASIDAFEPHPVHWRQLARNVEANGLHSRVTLHGVALGASRGQSYLVDAGTQSRVDDSMTNGIPVRVEDYFEQVGSRTIDLLKMDCEGAEYDMLMDDRFTTLPVRNLVVEWHAGAAHPDAHAKISGRLRDLGWELKDGLSGEIPGLKFGLLWGFRP